MALRSPAQCWLKKPCCSRPTNQPSTVVPLCNKTRAGGCFVIRQPTKTSQMNLNHSFLLVILWVCDSISFGAVVNCMQARVLPPLSTRNLTPKRAKKRTRWRCWMQGGSCRAPSIDRSINQNTSISYYDCVAWLVICSALFFSPSMLACDPIAPSARCFCQLLWGINAA